MSEPAIKQTISDWWATHPQTYGVVHGEALYDNAAGATEVLDFGSRDFFQRVDQTFYSWNRPLHSQAGHFTKIFPYDRYQNKPVLEVGCGLGTMAMNWAQHGAQVIAIDLNPVAVRQTAQRFKLFGLSGLIVEADANRLPFRDAFFDYAYSWGVLHHSPDLPHSVAELFRVLQPGAGFGVMLYHRESVLYRYFTLYLEGFLHAESRFLTPRQLASRYADGAAQEGNPHTWPVTEREARELFAAYSADLTIKIFGTDLDRSFPVLLPKMGAYVPQWLKKPWARRWGWSLWASGTKSS